MANIGEETEVINIPEPMTIPNTVPEYAPAIEAPEPEKVPA